MNENIMFVNRENELTLLEREYEREEAMSIMSLMEKGARQECVPEFSKNAAL